MTPAILILTVLTSAIAAGVVTYCLNISKERLLFIGRKSEELYCVVEALDFELSRFYGLRYSLVGGARRPGDIENLHRANADFATTRMLIGLYFPALWPHLARASAAAATAQSSLEALEDAPQSGRAPEIEGLDASVCELKDALDGLKTAILTAGHIANKRKFFALSSRSSEAISERRVLQVRA
jgi:hypothetical protein